MISLWRRTWLWLAFLSLAHPLGTARADRNLMLDVIINGYSQNLIGSFVERNGVLYATAEELDAIGFVNLDAGRPLIDLSAVPNLSYQYDEPTQSVRFDVPSTLLNPFVLDFGESEGTDTPPVQSGTGAVLNYNILGLANSDGSTLNGFLDGRVFHRGSVVDTSALYTSDDDTPSIVRLDSTFTYSAPDALRRYRLGDVITGGLAWTRPVRLGGAQIATDFALRPDLVTFPVPYLRDQVAVPSTVDLLVNGVRQLSRDVRPGPFEIRQPPVVTGAGDIALVVRDALGQETIRTLPFYASQTLLAPRLGDLTADVGFIRRDYGLRSSDYGRSAATVSYRYGASERVTVEAHGEATPGLAMGGAGIAVGLGQLGVVSLAGAASTDASSLGNLLNVSYERLTSTVSFAFAATVANDGFQDIAEEGGEPVPRLLTRASIGLSLGQYGTLGFNYSGVERQAASGTFDDDENSRNSFSTNLLPTSEAGTERVDLVSASYTKQLLGNLSFYSTGFIDLQDDESKGFLVGINVPLGSRGAVGASAGANGDSAEATLQANRSAAEIGHFGYQLSATQGDLDRELARLEYKSSFGRLEAGADRLDGTTAVRGTALGALAFTAGRLFTTNTIDDSFAVVDTEGAEGIEVLQENRPVGRTSAAGKLLVPDLRSYETNRIAIEPRDVPADADVEATSRLVRPHDRSGIVVYLPVRPSRGAILRLVDEVGVPIPLGGTVILRATGIASPIGYDGEAYVRDLGAMNQLDVTRPDGSTCSVKFNYHPIEGTIPELGPFSCKGDGQ